MPETNVRNSRSGTAAQLAAANRWLEDGETVVESDTGNTRTGPGHWNDLTPNLAAGGSGATAPPADEVAQWGAGFALNGQYPIDWVTGQSTTDPNEVIVVDTSTEWADPDVGVNGRPSPMVTETGRYYIFVEVAGNGAPSQAGDFAMAQFDLSIEEPDGDHILSYFLVKGRDTVVYPGTYEARALFQGVVDLQAGTHWELFGRGTAYDAVIGGAPATDAVATFRIGRVG